jgi:hypothetical protein
LGPPLNAAQFPETTRGPPSTMGVKERDRSLSIDPALRQRAIDAVLSQMDQQFGKGTVLRLGSRNVLSSGSISIDSGSAWAGFGEECSRSSGRNRRGKRRWRCR